MAIMSVSAICSFCNKPSTDPSCEVMIAQQSLTGTVSICDACVKLCVDIVAEKRAEVRLEKRAAEEAARTAQAQE